jgi:Uma2 family endonuclease
MTATITPPTPQAPSALAPRFDGVVLDGISWETYERLREELDRTRQHARIVYNEGRMLVMSPRPEHETWKMMLDGLLVMLATERNIPMRRLGSTTWRRRTLRKGLEADQYYYVQHESLVRGRMDIDLQHDPPPDLAVEIEFTHHPVDLPSLYAELGVPELWRYDGHRLTVSRLGPDRQYVPAEMSLAFPFLRPAELERFMAMAVTTDETSILLAFRDWVRKIPPTP